MMQLQGLLFPDGLNESANEVFKFVNVDGLKDGLIYMEENLNVTIPEDIKEQLRKNETVALSDYLKVGQDLFMP